MDKWLRLADNHAEIMSKDPRTKVACIILSQHPHVILSTGYNGMCRGIDDVWEQPMKDHMIVHAETNAVCNAARTGVSLENSIAVVTLFPCVACTKVLAHSGVKRVVTRQPDFTDPKWGDQFRMSSDILYKAGVEVIKI